MIQEINVKKTEKYTYPDFFLMILIDFLAQRKEKESKFATEETAEAKVSKYSITYLKYTNQFKKQFQLCLKMFDGKNANQYTDSFKQSTMKIFDEYLTDLVGKLIKFANDNINANKHLDLNFQDAEISNGHFSQLLNMKFEHYGKQVLENHPRPHECRKARINFSSPSTRKKVESKIRKIGKYASIHDALEFIEIRIGLFGKYKYKDLVDDLEELKNDFLINSSKNEIKTSKKNKTTKELVQEAFKNYEVVNSPQYLIDQNTYKSALRNKIKTTLNRN